MPRTMTVQGHGTVHVPPDTIVVTFTLNAASKDYAEMMQQADAQLAALQTAVSETAGILPEQLKTAGYAVNTNYEHQPDTNGRYTRVFAGYVCTHTLRLEIPLDMKLLANVFAAAEGSLAEPEFSVAFTVKDRRAVQEQVLANAAEHARRNAEILAKASGVQLGTLLSVSCQAKETEPVSATQCNMLRVASAAPDSSVQLTPEDITAEGTAEFVWEIL